MDRNVLDVIEREIDDEVRTRFPGAAVCRALLLKYGDDPQIEPGDLWVRVLLDSDGPEDYDRAWQAFAGPHQAAIEEFPRYLAEKVHEIMNVEFRFGDSTEAGCDRDGPQYGYPTGQRLSDYQEWERGEATFVRAPMGPAGLETLDTLIMAGIAATRSEAIRWAVDGSATCPPTSGSVSACAMPTRSKTSSGPRPGRGKPPGRSHQPGRTGTRLPPSSARSKTRPSSVSPAARSAGSGCSSTATTRKSSRATSGSG
jgi:hypothetical protein